MLRHDVPVVRTEGKAFDGGVAPTPEALLQRGSLLIVSSSKRTRDAETALGLDKSVYFYAGRVCPDFGDMAFAFKPEATHAWKGTATPFDSGGIFLDGQGKRFIFPLPDGVPPPEGGTATSDDVHSNAAARAYVDHYKCDLHEWQARFQETITRYFDGSVANYLAGEKPSRNDPTGRHHHPAHQQEQGSFRGRAWTWELQVAHDVEFLRAEGWSPDLLVVCFAWGHVQSLRQWVRARRPDGGAERARQWNRLQRSPVFRSASDLNSKERVADLVRERILEYLR